MSEEETVEFFHPVELEPIGTHATNHVVEGGWGGNKPMPCEVEPDGRQVNSCWAIPPETIRAMANNPLAIVVVSITDNGQMVVTLAPWEEHDNETSKD